MGFIGLQENSSYPQSTKASATERRKKTTLGVFSGSVYHLKTFLPCSAVLFNCHYVKFVKLCNLFLHLNQTSAFEDVRDFCFPTDCLISRNMEGKQQSFQELSELDKTASPRSSSQTGSKVVVFLRRNAFVILTVVGVALGESRS